MLFIFGHINSKPKTGAAISVACYFSDEDLNWAVLPVFSFSISVVGWPSNKSRLTFWQMLSICTGRRLWGTHTWPSRPACSGSAGQMASPGPHTNGSRTESSSRLGWGHNACSGCQTPEATCTVPINPVYASLTQRTLLTGNIKL